MNIVDFSLIVAASSSSDGDASWLPLLFLLSGPAYFFVMYSRYRNTSKRHLHEKETPAEIANLTGTDQKIKSVTGSSSSSMSGANHRDVHG